MKTIRLVGILLMVFVKNTCTSYITEVDAETVATGIMGLMVGALYVIVLMYLTIDIQQPSSVVSFHRSIFG